jgi:phage-related protein
MLNIIKEHIEFLGMSMGGFKVRDITHGIDHILEVRARPWSKIRCLVKLQGQILIISKFDEKSDGWITNRHEVDLANPNSMDELKSVLHDILRLA